MIFNRPDVINVFHMILVVGLLVVVALDLFPRNDIVSQRGFLLGLAVVVFLYHFYRLIRRRFVKEGLDEYEREICPPPVKLQVLTVEQGLSDVALTGANVHHIRIFDSDPGYSHPKLQINVGDVVVWTNIGELEHSVTAAKRVEWKLNEKMDPGCNFNSGLMKPGQTFAIKFTGKGWYPYYCTQHEGWHQGEIHVE